MTLQELIDQEGINLLLFEKAREAGFVYNDINGNVIVDDDEINKLNGQMWFNLENYIHKLLPLEIANPEELDETELAERISKEFYHNVLGLCNELLTKINYAAINGKEWIEDSFTPLTKNKDVMGRKRFYRNQLKEAINKIQINEQLNSYLLHLYNGLKWYLITY